MGRGTIPDPSWKSGPTYPEPTASEHAIDPQPDGADFDGFGVDEAERVEGEPLVAIQEVHYCARDGCDEGLIRRRLFTTYYLTHEEEEALRDTAGCELAEYVWEHAERTDVETVKIPIDGGPLYITEETSVEDQPHGECYGHVDEATRLGI